MSSTVIYTFTADGFCSGEMAEVRNAWRGAMAVWRTLEKKYLPPYRPCYVPKDISDDMLESYCGYVPTRLSAIDQEASKDIWNLFDREDVDMIDRIVLGTTFDHVMVKRENIHRVIDAFETFEGDTNLKEQAEALRELLKDEDKVAFAWNQTSVNAGEWMHSGIFDGEDELPYNFKTQDRHFWLFDELDKTAEAQHEE